MTSPTDKVWVIIFSRDWESGAFFIDITSSVETISDLKTEVKNRRLSHLSYINALDLTVWRCTVKSIRYRGLRASDHIRKLLSEEKLERWCADKRLADISIEETLLVEVPTKRPDGEPNMLNHISDEEFESFVLRARTRGEVTSVDLGRNDIDDAGKDDAPAFVQDYEKMLVQKRKGSDELLYGVAKTLVGASILEQYSEPPQPISNTDQFRDEWTHFICVPTAYMATVNAVELGSRKLFDEHEANAHFFYGLKGYIELVPSNVTVELDEFASWPFQLVMQVGNGDRYAYRPKSSFLILKFDLPRVAVEVNSYASGGHAVDHQRLLLEGATVVRFANTSLEVYRKKKDFVFMATFIDIARHAHRYLIYQEKGSDMVYCKRKIFDLGTPFERVTFLLELYNVSSTLQNENENENEKEDTRGKVRMLAERIERMDLPTFKKEPPSRDGENQHEPGVHREAASEQLKRFGYEVVPDVLETTHGTWERLPRSPPHIRTVYRLGDPEKTELIAKRVREGSNELEILQYLHSRQRRSPHVISLIEAITINDTKEWLILPNLHSLHYQLNRGSDFNRNNLGWGLIKGLAYLHEHNVAHRDIKPNNLVRDDKYCLQIIDFDIAIRVQNENTMVHDFRGTTGWTAPEVGTQDGPAQTYSPIRADRWACGQVLLSRIAVVDRGLQAFARQLMADDPTERPSPLEWLRAQALFRSALNGQILEGGGSWQDMEWSEEEEDEDDESMKLPDAKRARLESTMRNLLTPFPSPCSSRDAALERLRAACEGILHPLQ